MRVTDVETFVVVSGVTSILAAPEVLAGMTTHWSAAGQPDGTMPKATALALFATMTAGLLVVFALVPRVDPLRENVAECRPIYDWFVGIRIPWMLSSDDVWDRTHRLGSPPFKLTALVALVGLFLVEYAVYFLVVPALLTAGVTLVYPYFLSEQLERDSEPDVTE